MGMPHITSVDVCQFYMSNIMCNISVSLGRFPCGGRARLAPQSGGRPAPTHAPAPVPVRAARVVMICQLSGSRVAVGAPHRRSQTLPRASTHLFPLHTRPHSPHFPFPHRRDWVWPPAQMVRKRYTTRTLQLHCAHLRKRGEQPRAPALTLRRELTWYYIGLYIGLTKCLPRPSRVSLCQQGAGKMSSHGCQKFPT